MKNDTTNKYKGQTKFRRLFNIYNKDIIWNIMEEIRKIQATQQKNEQSIQKHEIKDI